MYVEVAKVKTGLPGAGDTQHAVGIGLIVRTQRTDSVGSLNILLDAGVVDAGVFRVGNEDTCRPLA